MTKKAQRSLGPRLGYLVAKTTCTNLAAPCVSGSLTGHEDGKAGKAGVRHVVLDGRRRRPRTHGNCEGRHPDQAEMVAEQRYRTDLAALSTRSSAYSLDGSMNTLIVAPN